jgi:hypothetical protein
LIWKPNWNYLIMFHYKVKTVYRQDGKCSFNSWMQNISNCRFYEAFQVKFYIKSKLTKSRITYSVPTVYISEIHCCIAKSPNLSTILPFCTKNIKLLKNWKLKIIVLLWQHLNASLRSVLPFRNTSCKFNVWKI